MGLRKRRSSSLPYNLPRKGDTTLSDLLNALEKRPPPTIDFPSLVNAMAVCGQGFAMGLNNGQVLYSSFFPDQTQTILHSDVPHKDSVTCLASSFDGRFVVTGSTDTTLKLWNVEKLNETATFKGHSKEVNCVVLTGDEAFCVSGSADRTVKVWNLSNYREIWAYGGHVKPIVHLSIIPDTDMCISGSAEGNLKVWNVTNMHEIAMFAGYSFDVNCMVVAPNGKACVLRTWDDVLKLWSLDEQKEVGRFEGNSEKVKKLVITSDSKFCISGSSKGVIKLWRLSTLSQVCVFSGHSGSITSLALPPDGLHVVSSSEDRLIKLWSLTSMCEVASFKGHSASAIQVVVGSSGNYCISAGKDKKIAMWTLVKRFETPILRHKNAVAFLTQAKETIVCAGENNIVKVWSASKRKEIGAFTGNSGKVTSISLSADGKICASAGEDCIIKVWSVETLQEMQVCQGHSDFVTCLQFHPAGQGLISGGDDCMIKLWKALITEDVTTFRGHTGKINCVAFVGKGKQIISGSEDCTLKLWDVETANEITTFEGHSAAICCFTLTADETRLISGSDDCGVKIWDLAKKEEGKVNTFYEHTDSVYCVAVTPNMHLCVSASRDATVKVWELATKRLFGSFSGPVDWTTSLSITPDNQFCLFFGDNSDLTIISLEEFRVFKKVNSGMTVGISCVMLSQDCQQAIVGGFDGTIRMPTLDIYPEIHSLEDSPPHELVVNIANFREGILRDKTVSNTRFTPNHFNSLHISAYYNQSERLQEYLRLGVDVLRGEFGSPLTIAIERKAISCVNVILQHLVTMARDASNSSVWVLFTPITDDLPKLLSCSSPLLVPFFSSLMQHPCFPDIPHFITPTETFTSTLHLDRRFVPLTQFDKSPRGVPGQLLVTFLISVIRWNLTPGSAASMHLLKSLAECEEKSVLNSEFVASIIEEKWEYFYGLTWKTTAAYGLLLANIVMIVFHVWRLDVLCYAFLALNGVFLAYEGAQMLAMRGDYLRDPWNYVDTARGLICIAWTIPVLTEHWDTDKYITLGVVMLCFLRGFTYFRAFEVTRIFVYMTIQVMMDIHSFLVIFVYCVFAFGMFTAVLLGDHGKAVPWTSAFHMVMGEFDSRVFAELEWAIFMGVGVATVIIVVNLLIAVLGNAYTKAQKSLRENDLHQMLALILEYESMMFWRKNDGKPQIILTCQSAEGAELTEEWTQPLLQINNALQSETKLIEMKVEGVDKNLEEKFKRMEERLGEVEERVGISVKEKVAEMEGKLGEILTMLQARG